MTGGLTTGLGTGTRTGGTMIGAIGGTTTGTGTGGAAGSEAAGMGGAAGIGGAAGMGGAAGGGGAAGSGAATGLGAAIGAGRLSFAAGPEASMGAGGSCVGTMRCCPGVGCNAMVPVVRMPIASAISRANTALMPATAKPLPISRAGLRRGSLSSGMKSFSMTTVGESASSSGTAL